MSNRKRKRNHKDKKNKETEVTLEGRKLFCGHKFCSQAEVRMAEFVTNNDLLQTKKIGVLNPKKDSEFIRIVEILVERRVAPSYRDEIRMAILLIKNGITNFEYSKKFTTTKIIFGKDSEEIEMPDHPPEGNMLVPNSREVDFWLPNPIKIVFCTEAVQAFEIKSGNLSIKSWSQRRELRDCPDHIVTSLVLSQYLDFWEKYGFTSLAVDFKDFFCKKIPLPSPQELVANQIVNSVECVWKMACILRENNIGYKHSSNEKWKNVLFLDKPVQVFWSPEPIEVIIVIPKGVEISIEDWLKRRMIISEGKNAFMALPQHMYFWKEWGFTRQKKRRN